MKFTFIFILTLFSSHSFSQDMKDISSSSEGFNNETLKRVLEEDKTNERKYIVGKFVCHNFAKTFYLQRSSLVEDLSAFDIKGIADDWGVVIQRLAETEKLPIYTVTLIQKEYGFYHMINAVLIDEKNPEKMESYVFIEPQSDAIMATPQDVYNRYSYYYDKTPEHEPLTLEIGLFESFKNNGYINQSWGKQLYQFEL